MTVVPDCPSAAERARTSLDAAPTVEVTLRGWAGTVLDHGSDHRGNPLLVVSAGSEPALSVTATGVVPARLRAARLLRMPLADRIRDRIEIHGRLVVLSRAQHPAALARLVRQRRWPPGDPLPAGAAVLRLDPVGVSLDGFAVPPDSYRLAEPDPLLAFDADLPTVLAGRSHLVAELTALLDPALATDATAVDAVAVDRLGLTVRVATRDHVRLVRVPFTEPVRDPRAAGAALVGLLTAAGRTHESARSDRSDRSARSS